MDDIWRKIIQDHGGFCKTCTKFSHCLNKCFSCKKQICSDKGGWYLRQKPNNIPICSTCMFLRASAFSTDIFLLY